MEQENCSPLKLVLNPFRDLWRSLISWILTRLIVIWFNDYGVDGGQASKALGPKFDVFTKRVQSHVAMQVPDIEVKHLAAAAVALKGVGGILFIFGSSLGAYLLVSTSTMLHYMVTLQWALEAAASAQAAS
uniref:Uncharacterized protein n=1 Tax=Fagus sylvatica TaxID=28930 RepID=A0A2N9IJY8_FAGSY